MNHRLILFFVCVISAAVGLMETLSGIVGFICRDKPDDVRTLTESLRKENISLVQPQFGHGPGGSRGEHPRRRQGEKGGGAKRVE